MTIRLNPDLLPSLLASIQDSKQSETIATLQLSSGKRVNQLSDDPVAAASVVQNHDHAAADGQFLQNLSTLQSKYQVADSTLGNVVSALTRALSLGVEGANGTLNPADRQAIAGEVQGLLNQAVALGNTTYQGAFLFAGTKVTTPPFSLDPATNAVTYNGNSQTTTVQLSNGDSINANLPGDQLFQNASGSVTGALQDLYTALTTGNNIPASVTEIQSALNQVSQQRVFYGNNLNQITQSESFLNQDKLNLSQQENSLVGADLATAASNFAQAQVANQATLNATARVLGLPTLLDFLK
ncbi:MAG TPA: flagellar hook-associated protein FlgL [Candidatus Acidoferrum sp.]|nr:flagellar hook-associated protein FlgL [Candidatus Acidoferrum sp.]